MGSVLQLSMSISAATFGPTMAVFLMGLFCPWVNTQGIFTGAVSGVIFMSYITFRAQAEIATGAILFPTKPMSIEGCTYDFDHAFVNTTSSTPDVAHEKSLHNLSYLYYTAFGAVITTIISLSFSFIVGLRDPHSVDPKLLAPFIRKFFANKVPVQLEIDLLTREKLFQNEYCDRVEQ